MEKTWFLSPQALLMHISNAKFKRDKVTSIKIVTLCQDTFMFWLNSYAIILITGVVSSYWEKKCHKLLQEPLARELKSFIKIKIFSWRVRICNWNLNYVFLNSVLTPHWTQLKFHGKILKTEKIMKENLKMNVFTHLLEELHSLNVEIHTCMVHTLNT